jgi:DNA-binding CsgD family transcriptional regulator
MDYHEKFFFVIYRTLLSKKSNEMAIKLTNREIEVLKLIAKELTTEQIARYLNIRVPTVETHRRNMFKKMGVSSVIGLIKESLKNNWIQI